MYSCSTVQWCFGKEPSIVAQGTCTSVLEFMQPEHKKIERSQPETTSTVLKPIKNYLVTISVHACLGAGQGLSTMPAFQNNQKM